MKKIINLNGTLVELSRIKGICINSEGFTEIKLAPNQIKILLSGRKEYIYNPERRAYELIYIEDEIIIEYPNTEYAYSNFLGLMEIWETTLNQ